MGITGLPTTSAVRALTKVNNRYAYPNASSYVSNGRTGTLRKGAICGMTDEYDVRDVASAITGGLVKRPVLDLNFYKEFQFNPANIAFAINATATVPADTTAPGAGDKSGAVGYASTQIELMFYRDIEVARSNYNPNNSNISGQPTDPERDLLQKIGVQRDIYDLYRVLLGTQAEELTLPPEQSVFGISQSMYDLAAGGGNIIFGNVAIIFNDQFVVFGQPTSMNFGFEMFNHNLVPTAARVTLGLGLFNIGTRSSVVASSRPATSSVVESAMPTSATPATGTATGIASGLGPATATVDTPDAFDYLDTILGSS